jgi:predicted aminopeptidase
MKPPFAACSRKNRLTRSRRKPVVPHGAIQVFLCLLLLAANSGCRAGYLFHVGMGQWDLMHNARPLEELKAEGGLSGEQLAAAELVQEIRDFGESELGLEPTENYREVYLGERPPVYTVSASPKDRLQLRTWWFPIAGRVPYLGFFDPEKARREQRDLQSQDMDTVVRQAAAYSTLGWFQDPVTPALLKLRPAGLAEIILHELTHVTVYEPGQGDFNEGLAVLVGLEGARRFCENRFGPNHEETRFAESAIHDEHVFSGFMERAFARLEALYGEGLEYGEVVIRREAVFRDILDEFDLIRKELKTDRFSGFGIHGLNNAYLLSVGLYHRSYAVFEDLFRQCGSDPARTLSVAAALAEDAEDIPLLDKVRQWTDSARAES